MRRRHLVQVRSLDGTIQWEERYGTRRRAQREADALRSPFYDVLINRKVAHRHIPAWRLLQDLPQPDRPTMDLLVADPPGIGEILGGYGRVMYVGIGTIILIVILILLLA